MIAVVLGILLMCTATDIDWVIRLRMAEAGQKKALILGGAFDYREYLKLCTKYGWSPWLVYLALVLLFPGIALLFLGFLKINHLSIYHG
jgi:hypothetical protein